MKTDKSEQRSFKTFFVLLGYKKLLILVRLNYGVFERVHVDQMAGDVVAILTVYHH